MTPCSRIRLARLRLRLRRQPPRSRQEATTPTPAQPGVGQMVGTATAQPIAGTRQPTMILLEAAPLHLATRQAEEGAEADLPMIHPRHHRRRRPSRTARTRTRLIQFISLVALGTS